MWVGKDALATLAHLSPPTLPDATQEAHANFAASHRTTHSSCVARVVRCGGSVLRAPPALRAERLSALLRVQATSLRSVTCTLRRADTLLVRLCRLASRSYHRPLESPTSKHYHRPLPERHAGGARQLRRLSHRTTHPPASGAMSDAGGSVLRAPPALRAERLSALLRVQATSLRSVTCTLRRADTLLVRLRRLGARSYHRPLGNRRAYRGAQAIPHKQG